LSGKLGFKVVIADSPFPTDDVEREVLNRVGAEVHRFHCKSEDDVMEKAGEADAVLCDLAPLSRRVLFHLKRARVIAEYGIGYDNIDVKAASERGIIVCNAPDFLTYEVADHTVGLILALVRKIPWIYVSTKGGEWNWEKFKPIQNLDGKTVGIIGFGRIGRQVAERLEAFKVRIVAYDPYVPSELLRQLKVEPLDLDTLLREADIVTVHTALTEETKHLIGEGELKLMKKSAVLVNAARGAIIDQGALYKALKNGWINAAALDVLEKEPPSAHEPLLKLENVIVTPHIAWYSEKSVLRLQRIPAEEVARVLMGERPRHPVNPEILPKITNKT